MVINVEMWKKSAVLSDEFFLTQLLRSPAAALTENSNVPCIIGRFVAYSGCVYGSTAKLI